MHDLFEKTASELESVIETFYVNGYSGCGGDVSAELSDEADDEHMHRVLEKEMYMKIEVPVPPPVGGADAKKEEESEE